ncbi:MAG: sugar ABC transporter ATP-binding protein [Opitutaceae bacterium]|nr:sugar ABC transporter ATP-binding protein [Opitutaceae bacterium]
MVGKPPNIPAAPSVGLRFTSQSARPAGNIEELSMSETMLLRMQNIHKRFPGVYALDSVALELRAGEIHALLGENGAGKSTLIKILGGIYHADEGKIFINGKKVNIQDVRKSEENSISIIHQELVLVPHMTVAENIFLGKEPGKGIFVSRRTMNEQAQALLDAHEMRIQADRRVSELTIAQQQMVEIVKAISRDSRILVMDEPTSSLSEKEVAFLFETMRSLKGKGVGIIYISHRMSELWQICDRVTVLRDGQSVGTRTITDTSREELIALMVGRPLNNLYIRDYQQPGKIVLEARNVSDGRLVKNASFCLREGEILGFAGLIGSGRSELMKCLFGLNHLKEGTVLVNQKPVSIRTPEEAMAMRIALVPESRKEEALFPVQSVRFNITLEVLKTFIRGAYVNKTKEENIAREYIGKLSIKTPSPDQIIGNLSGGNQQKAIIGRWLATSPKILILDEPTRGIDIGAKSEIYKIMNYLASQGMAIIMISSELAEIINMSDRTCVMSEGTVAGCLDRNEMSQEQIMHLAANN